MHYTDVLLFLVGHELVLDVAHHYEPQVQHIRELNNMLQIVDVLQQNQIHAREHVQQEARN